MTTQINWTFSSILLAYFIVSCAGSEFEDVGLTKEDSAILQASQFPIPVQDFNHRVKRMPQSIQFDVAKWIRIGECPQKSLDGVQFFYCPSLTADGQHSCIDDHQLCNGMKECPNAEDENRNYCFFYKALKAQIDNIEKGMGALGQIFHQQQEQFSMRSRKYGKKFYNY